MRWVFALLLLALLALLASVLAAKSSGSDGRSALAYPEGYRDWSHVKSALVNPAHAQFASIGGFHHIYANAAAMDGYRTRAFPEGSVIVFDWLQLDDKGGSFEEGERRQLDVMVKDSRRYGDTGGWGFQRFVGDSKRELAAAPTPAQCFACHERLKTDGLVLSRYRQ